MAQRDNGSGVLKRIKAFLYSEGVPLNIYPVRSCQDTHTLCTHKRAIVKKFLLQIYPYLIVKREESKRALEIIYKRDWYERAGPERRRKAAVLYQQGHSVLQIKSLLKMSKESICRGLCEHRVGRRNKHDVMTLAWRLRRKNAVSS